MSTPTVNLQRAARQNRRRARTRLWEDCARREALDRTRRAVLRTDVAAFRHTLDAPTPPKPHIVLYERCLAGREPAESLPCKQRELLVAELCTAGWTDLQIAGHTRLTLYTTARIRARLGLSPN